MLLVGVQILLLAHCLGDQTVYCCGYTLKINNLFAWQLYESDEISVFFEASDED